MLQNKRFVIWTQIQFQQIIKESFYNKYFINGRGLRNIILWNKDSSKKNSWNSRFSAFFFYYTDILGFGGLTFFKFLLFNNSLDLLE